MENGSRFLQTETKLYPWAEFVKMHEHSRGLPAQRAGEEGGDWDNIVPRHEKRTIHLFTVFIFVGFGS